MSTFTCEWCGKAASRYGQKRTHRFCGKSCSGFALGAVVSKRIAATFWDRVDSSGGLNACWPWIGRPAGNGYGVFGAKMLGEAVRGPHRAAFVLSRGMHPSLGQVLHTCDFRLCCNPWHLFDGTQRDNMTDMIAKGREASIEVKRHLGSAHGRAKVTEADVPVIRDIGRDTKQHKVLAIKYGVSRSLISQIARGKIWRHVP